MADCTVPKIKRIGRGRYEMRCGEEAVAIGRTLKPNPSWYAVPRSASRDIVFRRTKAEACEYAYDWLTEHA